MLGGAELILQTAASAEPRKASEPLRIGTSVKSETIPLRDRKGLGNSVEWFFMYVGAEVTIGSFLVNFLSQSDIAGLSESAVGRYVSIYWGSAMLARFIGVVVLRRVKPASMLASSTRAASALRGIRGQIQRAFACSLELRLRPGHTHLQRGSARGSTRRRRYRLQSR